MTQQTLNYDHAPLISSRFIWKLTAAIALVCALIVAISVAGRIIGRSIVMAGHTTDTSLREIVIGNDVLMLPANVIRFESQRVSGVQKSVDTYFVWPGMNGYSQDRQQVFNQTESADGLIFASVSLSTMAKDMSGRFTPIYRRLVTGAPVPGPAGLDSWRLKPGAGYTNELLYADRTGGAEPYVVRCLIDDTTVDHDFITRTGCQRDIALGADLSVSYRFAVELLPHWREIESDVRATFDAALISPSPATRP
ncbi:hypothetical protein DFR52_101682 [Hoeflea marina]|uniref:Uncharacterized protein n=1 Tax=Hoeflea marina TaxID=274592 RepID=A0A317PR86_9HYPH|nr:hypothetical protein [Hoeflea marina]PWW03993.1 hypothetical protein DFR52_101682 [Hoeflea marina]